MSKVLNGNGPMQLITLQLAQLEDMRRYIRFLESELLDYQGDHKRCSRCSHIFNTNQSWDINDGEIRECLNGEFCSDICADLENKAAESFEQTLRSLDR